MHSKNNVIRNLRAKNKKLVDKLEAVKNWHEDVKMDPDDRYRLEKILEAEE